MILAQHNKHYVSFFNWFIHRLIKKNFHSVHYEGTVNAEQLKNSPLLAIGNHFSWWDGFWMYELNRVKLGKRYHVLMLYEQLKTRPYFNKIGAAGFKKNSRHILKLIDYCAGLLLNKNNILFFFPEGEIRPQNQSELKFEKGIMRIIQKSPDDLHVVFIVNLTEYFTNKKPTLYTYYKSCDAKTFKTITEMEKAYNGFYLECKLRLNNEIT